MDEDTSFQPKRQRTANFSSSELEILVDEANVHHTILNAPHSSTVTNGKKMKIWSEIANKINATCGSKRTADQLRKKWNEYKCQTRKKAREFHKEMHKTGGGSAPVIQITDTEQKVLKNVISLIPKCSITGIPGGTETVVSQHGTTAESENVPTAVDMIDIDNVTVTDPTLGTCTPLPVQVTYVQQVQPEIKADGRADDAAERLVQLEEIKVELLKERVQIERERLTEERRRREIEERRLELEERRLALESNRI